MLLILRITVSTAVFLLLSWSVLAQETKTVRITSKEPKPVHIDSVIPELQGIVVLCATEPDSAEFNDQWRNFTRRHKIRKNDLGPLIFRVINEAEAYRGNERLNRGETPDDSRDRRAKIYRKMHDTAMAVIRKTG
jgi:hypothetical protein